MADKEKMLADAEKSSFKISAVMMVKDEAKLIKRCLNSIRNVVDECVVVDTGSTDGTLEILKEYEAKENDWLRLYQEPWKDNFGEMRNRTIELAKYPVVFIIDGDEEFVFVEGTDVTKFRNEVEEILTNTDCNTIEVIANDYQKGKVVTEINAARILKKEVAVWSGEVHHKLDWDELKVMHYPYVRFNHFGYDETVIGSKKFEEKRQRRLRLMHKLHEENPDEERYLFYLNQAYSLEGDYRNSVKYGNEFIKKVHGRGEKVPNPTVYYTTIRSAMHLGQLERARKLLDIGIREHPEYLDLYINLMEYGIASNNGKLAEEGCIRYIQIYKALSHDPTIRKNSFVFNFRQDILLKVVYSLAMNKFEAGLEQLQVIERALPKLPKDQKNWIVNLILQGFTNLKVFETVGRLQSELQ